MVNQIILQDDFNVKKLFIAVSISISDVLLSETL